jgi:hypothetical protein
MTPAPKRRRSGALLLGFALVLMLHPASGAAQSTGEGIGGVLKVLFCLCCAEPAPIEESGCCMDEPVEPVDDCKGDCSCAHELELPDQVPLASPPATAEGSAATLVLAHARVSAATVELGRDLAPHSTGPPGPALLRTWSGSSPFRLLAAGPNGLLAALCTARI